MTYPQLLAKYITCYLQPITKHWELVGDMFTDMGHLAQMELAGELTHREVRHTLELRVRDAKRVINGESLTVIPCAGLAPGYYYTPRETS